MITIKSLKENIINFIDNGRDAKYQQQIKELNEKIDISVKKIKIIEETPMFKPVSSWTPTQPLVPYKPIITCNDSSVWVINGELYNLTAEPSVCEEETVILDFLSCYSNYIS